MLRSFVFLSAFFCAISAFSQEEAIRTEQKQTTERSPEKVQAIQKELNQVNYHLESIRTKREYILSNEEEKAIAEAEGWFTKMEEVEQRLIAKKQMLEAKLAN